MFGFSKMFWCFFPETSAKRTHVHWCSGCFSWMNPNQFYEGCFPPNINFYLKNPFHAFLWTYYESTRSTRLRGGLWTAVWAPPRPRKSLGETCRSYKSLWLVSRSDEHLHLKQDAWVETSDNSCWFLEIIGNLMDKSETSNNANFFPGDYEELWRLSLHLSWSFDMSWTNSSHQTKKNAWEQYWKTFQTCTTSEIFRNTSIHLTSSTVGFLTCFTWTKLRQLRPSCSEKQEKPNGLGLNDLLHWAPWPFFNPQENTITINTMCLL